ncbi:MAG: 16S rRNA (cytidine(1402)-2'-O)-methyltransferase [Ignavibacteria bacterium]|nr:MAG: 16S rRNA (cytidine(1402)-2'-O)-methyltransferase [Ignavibacteria bacterium]
MKTGTLYIVGTPIGDPGDISLRAIETLKSVDYIACEERKTALRLLREHGVEKELVEVNEHTEREETEQIVLDLAMGQDIALISDCGMPVFADPGTHLLTEALDTGIRVTAVPGPTSLTTALALSGFDAHRFYFYGFLSPKRPERKSELQRLRNFDDPVVFLDAPYRLVQVLEDLTASFGNGRSACVACDLTLPKEEVRRGTLKQLRDHFRKHNAKREFVIIVGAYEKRNARG